MTTHRGPALGGIERARRACLALSKAARAHRLYASNNSTLQRMFDELDRSFQDLLAHEPRIIFQVRRTGFELDGTSVFTEEHIEESLPFAFYRDGIRRIGFSQGLTRTELDGLLEATSQRLHYSGLGEDIVSLLWRLDLEHIDYVVVDTTLVSADPNAGSSAESADYGQAADARLGGVLQALFGPGGEDAPVSMHLDAHDVPAKAIADALERPDTMTPGLFPTSGLRFEARYARAISDEVVEEGENAVAIRGIEGALRALTAPMPEMEAEELGEALIRMLDTAILENQYSIAARIVQGMRHAPMPRERISAWMDQVVAEARIRHVGARFTAARTDDEERARIFGFFRWCGGWAVQPLLNLMPSISHAPTRRQIADLILEFGIFDIDLLMPLLGSDQAFVALEAVYILSRLNQDKSLELLRQVRHHPLAPVRAALADFAEGLPKEVASDVVANLLDDEDPRVRSSAARALAKHPSKTNQLLLESASQKNRLEGTTAEVKKAMLEAYAEVAQDHAVPQLTRMLRDGDGLFATREQEDLAVASVWALARIRSVTAVEIIKRTCSSRNRRLKQAAREALVWMRKNV